jgi:hypothetical protein
MELIGKLKQLAEATNEANEKAAAVILYTLAGALSAHTERELMELCARHAQTEINRITAWNN